MPDTETGLFTKKKGMNKNEKGNLEINSADHRDCAHCTLHITRSYELHVVLESFTKSSQTETELTTKFESGKTESATEIEFIEI